MRECADKAQDQPNPADFSVNARDREYYATITFTGTIEIDIKADSTDEARQSAQKLLDRFSSGDGDALEVMPEDIEEARLDAVLKRRPLYRVTRDGKTMQVSRLAPGDLPREPDECGF